MILRHVAYYAIAFSSTAQHCIELSRAALPCLVLPYPTLSYPTLLYPVLSCPIVRCLVSLEASLLYSALLSLTRPYSDIQTLFPCRPRILHPPLFRSFLLFFFLSAFCPYFPTFHALEFISLTFPLLSSSIQVSPLYSLFSLFSVISCSLRSLLHAE